MSAIELYARPSPQFGQRVAHSIALLQRVAQDHPKLTQASSLGAEDIVVTHLLHLAGVHSAIFVLDTGKLPAETLALIGRLEARYARSIELYRPVQQAVVKFVRAHGERAMYDSMERRKQCCDIRKMEPLARALAGKDGWITGLRREQSTARAEVSELVVETLAASQAHVTTGASAAATGAARGAAWGATAAEATGAPTSARSGEIPGGTVETRPAGRQTRLKVSPLVDWSWGDVWHFIALHRLDYNALHDQFYPSIGCEPCTRAISVGEDFRAGRWWWEQESAKECGLHLAGSSPPSPLSQLSPLSPLSPPQPSHRTQPST